MTVRNRPISPSRKARGGTLVGMFIGLVLGVCLAAGVVLFINRSHTPFLSKQQQAEGTTTTPAKPGSPQQPLVLSGKPGDPMPQKRFDFHDILTGKGESTPAQKPQTEKPDANQKTKTEAKPGESKETAPGETKQTLYFQAGSFSSAEDADNQKARLALMGVEASVLQVMLQEKTFYRVRIGPYASAQDASRVRAELARNGINVTLIPKEK